jgi:hypothetical protein
MGKAKVTFNNFLSLEDLHWNRSTAFCEWDMYVICMGTVLTIVVGICISM